MRRSLLLEICSECSGQVKVIFCIENPAVIKKTLTHFEKNRFSRTYNDCPKVVCRRKLICSIKEKMKRTKTTGNIAE